MTGNRVRIELRLSVPVQAPKSFVIFDPARIAIDFPGVKLNLPQKSQTINYGLTHSVSAAETPDRTRVVINLVRLVPYKMEITNGTIYITIGESGDTKNYPGELNKSQIESVVFEQGNAGEGRIHVKLSDPFTVIDTYEEGNNIIVDFFATELPEDLNRVLDVTDFATPILSIDTFARGDSTRMIIKTTGNYEHLAYQTHHQQFFDLKPIK
jgi:type IV pilus assembly protein PilQ